MAGIGSNQALAFFLAQACKELGTAQPQLVLICETRYIIVPRSYFDLERSYMIFGNTSNARFAAKVKYRILYTDIILYTDNA